MVHTDGADEQKQRSGAERNAQDMNARRPCHRDLQTVVENELQKCELVQGRHQSILVLDHEHRQTPRNVLYALRHIDLERIGISRKPAVTRIQMGM